jgi:hypothetical protein
MTAQIAEKLLYLGERHSMCGTPLAMYFELSGVNPDFDEPSTALWRGYVGSWEVIDDRLYLVGLAGHLNDGTPANLATIFPDYPDRAFAHWYSGKARLPQGKLLKYVHAGYGSIYERDLFLHFENGVLTKTELIENGVATDPHAPEGYGIGGMTIFPSVKNAVADGGDK